MENCQKKVSSFAVSRTVFLMGIFDWKLIKEDKNNSGKSILFFNRDDSVPYYKEMVEIEKEMEPKLLPIWPFIASVALAFVAFTLYLILFLVMREDFPTTLYFFIIFLPGMLLLSVSTMFFYFRSKQLLSFIKSESNRLSDVQNRIYELKVKYGKEKEKN